MIDLLHDAARGRFPPEDGRTDVVAAVAGAPAAALSFTAHHVVAADVPAEEVRRRGYDLGVILVTAFGSIESAVEAMRVGADDYLTKPFAFAELLARVRALMRRGSQVLAVLS